MVGESANFTGAKLYGSHGVTLDLAHPDCIDIMVIH